MSRIHEGLAYKEFDMPAGIVSAEVCKKSGMLPKDGVCQHDQRGDMVVTEYFAEGTVPEEPCEHHTSARICPSSGMLAGPYCPGGAYASSVRIVGGSPDSEDGPYLYTGSRRTCNIHTSPQTVEPDTPDDNTVIDDPSVADPDGMQDPGADPGTGTDPGAGEGPGTGATQDPGGNVPPAGDTGNNDTFQPEGGVPPDQTPPDQGGMGEFIGD